MHSMGLKPYLIAFCICRKRPTEFLNEIFAPKQKAEDFEHDVRRRNQIKRASDCAQTSC